MKVFVAGATGVLGTRAVKQLVAAGHEVTGVARSPEKADVVSSLGGRPALVDIFDSPALEQAVSGHDVVCNLATHIPTLSRAAMPGAWDENGRIRREGSHNLVEAALAAGATRYVQESIAFMYADSGHALIDEDTPQDAPGLGESVLAAEAATRRYTETGGTGVVLRFGQFYAPEASHTIAMNKAARRRVAPVLGPKDGYVSMIAADDAASAVVTALVAPAGTYNVTDDEPLTRYELGQVLASALGVKPPRFLPAAVGKLAGANGRFLMRSQRVSNARFKAATGWSPKYPSVREGWAAVAVEASHA